MAIGFRRVAIEWLIFFGALLFGLAFAPSAAFLATRTPFGLLPNFYETLFGLTHERIGICWAVVASPYVLVQLWRSARWTIRTLRS